VKLALRRYIQLGKQDEAEARQTWPDNLAGVHGRGDEGGLREELGGAQQVAPALVVPLVLLHRLHVHLLLGQQRLVARRVAGRRQELEVAVATAQQEAHSGGGEGGGGG